MWKTGSTVATLVAAVVISVAPAALPAFALAAVADPCAVRHEGDLQNHRGTFTAHITHNPCGIRVRAYVACAVNFGETRWGYGQYITGIGSSTADCGNFIPFGPERGVSA